MAITLEQARKTLGETSKKMTDEEVQNIIVLFDSLAETWLGQYERMIFKGRTVDEIDRGITPNLNENEQKSQKKFEEYFKEWEAKQR